MPTERLSDEAWAHIRRAKSGARITGVQPLVRVELSERGYVVYDYADMDTVIVTRDGANAGRGRETAHG